MSICHYCKQREGDSNSTYKAKMHKNIAQKTANWTPIEHTLTTTYIPKVVDVPRCSKCKEIHSYLEGMRGIGIIIGFFALPIYALIHDGSGLFTIGWGGFAVLVIGMVIGGIVAGLVGNTVSYLVYKPESDVKGSPEVQAAMQEGYILGEKPRKEGRTVR